MITWPPSLVPEVAERRCIVFLGAGVSRSSEGRAGKRPPNWPGLLATLAGKMRNHSERLVADQLIKECKYLEAAEVIRADLSGADFAMALHQELSEPNYTPSKLHEAVRSLDLKVTVTTNYDQIYEACCDQGGADKYYNTCMYYQSHLVNDLKSSRRLIVKAHGCLSDPSKAMLTRGEYFRARRDYGNFYDILDALFTTNTILFLGYSLDDPDIRLVLENVHITAPTVSPHYAVVEEGQHSAIKRAIKDSYNVELLEFSKGGYNEVIDAVRQLSDDVAIYRDTH